MFHLAKPALISSDFIVSGPQSYRISSRKIPSALDSLVMISIVIIEVSLIAKWPSVDGAVVRTLMEAIRTS